MYARLLYEAMGIDHNELDSYTLWCISPDFIAFLCVNHTFYCEIKLPGPSKTGVSKCLSNSNHILPIV